MGDRSAIETIDRKTRIQVRMIRAAATKIGISAREYAEHVVAREKWCSGCRAWHPLSVFSTDRSRGDGLRATCADGARRRYVRKANPGPFGPSPAAPRDGDKRQARRRVNVLVRTGRLPHPNTLPCTDCGHEWPEGERRHEYDHRSGYGAEAHLSVDAVCTTCHHRRERERAA